MGTRGCMQYVLWYFIGIGLLFKKMQVGCFGGRESFYFFKNLLYILQMSVMSRLCRGQCRAWEGTRKGRSWHSFECMHTALLCDLF